MVAWVELVWNAQHAARNEKHHRSWPRVVRSAQTAAVPCVCCHILSLGRLYVYVAAAVFTSNRKGSGRAVVSVIHQLMSLHHYSMLRQLYALTLRKQDVPSSEEANSSSSNSPLASFLLCTCQEPQGYLMLDIGPLQKESQLYFRSRTWSLQL